MRNAIDAFILQRLQEKGIVPGAEADKITLLRREKAGRFGRMGQRPTHSELVDWLADEFVRSGWRLKRMHRLMVTSAPYRQSSLFARTRIVWTP